VANSDFRLPLQLRGSGGFKPRFPKPKINIFEYRGSESFKQVKFTGFLDNYKHKSRKTPANERTVPLKIVLEFKKKGRLPLATALIHSLSTKATYSDL
jgi:hypothetical protein